MSLVREYINFERGRDPKETLELGIEKDVVRLIKIFLDIFITEGQNGDFYRFRGFSSTDPAYFKLIRCSKEGITTITSINENHHIVDYLDDKFKRTGLEKFVIMKVGPTMLWPKIRQTNTDTQYTYAWKEEYKGMFNNPKEFKKI
jgi:hypothetical protein